MRGDTRRSGPAERRQGSAERRTQTRRDQEPIIVPPTAERRAMEPAPASRHPVGLASRRTAQTDRRQGPVERRVGSADRRTRTPAAAPVPDLDQDSFITVVCSNCGQAFQERVGRLRTISLFRHFACNTYLETDPGELDAFLKKEAQNPLAKLNLRALVPKRGD